MSSSTRRLIDELPTLSPRPVEMQVLALGMSRTGTMSLQAALHQLGYKSYHMIEAARTRTFPYWLEALRAKYRDDAKPYQRAEFDKLLGNFSAVTDIPCIMFVDELLAAYPDAKIVLTERDTESWLVSMENTFYVLLGWKSLYYLAPLGPKRIDAYWKVLNLVVSIWTSGDIQNRQKLRQTYIDHYAHIRRVVSKDKILEFNPKDGFGKLCQFLGKPLPVEGQYPHINRPDNIIKLHTTLWWYLLAKVLQRFLTYLLPVGVAACSVWYYRSRV